jgi:hypothetical protein
MFFMLSVVILNTVMLSVTYCERLNLIHYAECRYAECCNSVQYTIRLIVIMILAAYASSCLCSVAYEECHYAECHGAALKVQNVSEPRLSLAFL